jgi:hypothetical protein
VDVVPDQKRVERGDRRADDPDLKRGHPPADLEHDRRGQRSDGDLRDPDHEPVPLEDLVEAREEPGIERLRVSRRPARQEPERSARDERLREAVALLDERLEDPPAFDQEHDHARRDRRCQHDGERLASRHPARAASAPASEAG